MGKVYATSYTYFKMKTRGRVCTGMSTSVNLATLHTKYRLVDTKFKKKKKKGGGGGEIFKKRKKCTAADSPAAELSGAQGWSTRTPQENVPRDPSLTLSPYQFPETTSRRRQLDGYFQEPLSPLPTSELCHRKIVGKTEGPI